MTSFIQVLSEDKTVTFLNMAHIVRVAFNADKTHANVVLSTGDKNMLKDEFATKLYDFLSGKAQKSSGK
jgi:hypothetical protein